MMKSGLFLCYSIFLAIISAVTAQQVVVHQWQIPEQPVTILQGNDDGFGAAYIRALYLTLKGAGYKVTMTFISAISNPKQLSNH
jgi:hypothetical protein